MNTEWDALPDTIRTFMTALDARDDDQALAIPAQVAVRLPGSQRYGTPWRALATHRACVEPGERGRHDVDARIRRTPSGGIEPAAKSAQTRISAGGG